MERSLAAGTPLLHPDVAPDRVGGGSGPAPLRACLLSGGASRRMGTDKALLPHPEGGTWLERSLQLLATTGAPLTLFSRWPRHLEIGARLTQDLAANGVTLELLPEPEPAQGPLWALGRLMEQHPDQRLLLCPVDMPALSASVLAALQTASAAAPALIHLADDGERLQPLLGVYPSDVGHRQRLRLALEAGERRWLGWLAGERLMPLLLDPVLLANVNTPEQLSGLIPDRDPL